MTLNQKQNNTPALKPILLLCLLLLAATTLIYAQVLTHDFIIYDDIAYVTHNPIVQSGLTFGNFIWALTSLQVANWHPLTWLSHMLDCQLFGLNAGFHHATSLIFHLLNTVLLFLILHYMTRKIGPAVFVAALFALHPLHVESVAWISERKDVLSTLWGLLSIGAYAVYTKNKKPVYYVSALLCLALGLMAKPMLVTLPFVLLLLDYWPLERLHFRKIDGDKEIDQPASNLVLLVKEKIPFFILISLSSVVTIVAQQKSGAVGTMEVYSLYARITNAIVSYAVYLRKMVIPYDLAVFYPHPGSAPFWHIAVAALVLLSVSIYSIKKVQKFPYLLIGWLMYIGTLVPVIGLVQVGDQAMSDRYTYIPLIGCFVIIGYGLKDLSRKWPHQRILYPVMMGTLVLIYSLCSWYQIGYWQNSIALFKHAVKVTDHNFLANYTLGLAYAKNNDLPEAIDAFSRAIEIKPDSGEMYVNRGIALARSGRLMESISDLKKAEAFNPENANVHKNLGVALRNAGNFDAAVKHLKRALALEPNSAKTYFNMGLALAQKGELDAAIANFEKSIQSQPARMPYDDLVHTATREPERPDYARIHYHWGLALKKKKMLSEAVAHFQKALKIKPGYTETINELTVIYNYLGGTAGNQGDLKQAVVFFKKALEINPKFKDAKKNLKKAEALLKQKRSK